MSIREESSTKFGTPKVKQLMHQGATRWYKERQNGDNERNQNPMARVPKLEPLDAPASPGSAKERVLKPVATAEDRELVRRAQSADKEAFEELIRRHQHRVFAVAGGILKRREDVEDVAQQVFVKAYFSLKRFDQRAAFSTWLYKITVNECWDLLRKKKVRPLVYEADLSEEQSRKALQSAEQGQDGPDVSERLAARQQVERLLLGLDERDRLMLILKEVEGFSIEEIAEVMDLNANTVKVRLFRARRRVVSQAKADGSQRLR
jgi:RNA polymerase sigma-70 factor (ECF subfamily)